MVWTRGPTRGEGPPKPSIPAPQSPQQNTTSKSGSGRNRLRLVVFLCTRKMIFFLSGFSSSFLFLFLLLLKLLPPPPKSAFLSIDFFNLPHFIKTLKYSLWNVCALCPQRRRPPTPHSPGLAPQSPRHLVLGLGGVGGNLGIRTPGHALQAAPAVG